MQILIRSAVAHGSGCKRNEVKTTTCTVLYHAREPRIDADHETFLQPRDNIGGQKKTRKKPSLGSFGKF